MRRVTSFVSLALFVGTVGFAVACSEQQPASPTAPAAGAAGITTSQGVSMTQVSAAGKPIPGFTKVIEVTATAVVEANEIANAFAACPPGTTVVGGGFRFTGGSGAHPPWTKASWAIQNGWSVDVLNQVVDASPAGFAAFAYCAS
jgi:hypothetical protein